MPDKTSRSRSRRRFLKLVPAAVGAGFAAPRALVRGAEQQSPIGADALECAEHVTGLAFTGAEHELMRQAVATNRDHFDALRRVVIDYDVEPAFTFKPYHAGPLPTGRATPHARLRVDRPAVNR